MMMMMMIMMYNSHLILNTERQLIKTVRLSSNLRYFTVSVNLLLDMVAIKTGLPSLSDHKKVRALTSSISTGFQSLQSCVELLSFQALYSTSGFSVCLKHGVVHHFICDKKWKCFHEIVGTMC